MIAFDLEKGPCKVGIAQDPAKRMAGLQTAHHQKLILVGTWRLIDREAALALELSFHETQSDTRLNGEWFDMPPRKAMATLMIGLGVMLNVRYGLEPAQVNEVLSASADENWRKIV